MFVCFTSIFKNNLQVKQNPNHDRHTVYLAPVRQMHDSHMPHNSLDLLNLRDKKLLKI